MCIRDRLGVLCELPSFSHTAMRASLLELLKMIERYITAAQQHGLDSDPDHEVGDLQGYLRAAWQLLTMGQRAQFEQIPLVKETYATATCADEDGG